MGRMKNQAGAWKRRWLSRLFPTKRLFFVELTEFRFGRPFPQCEFAQFPIYPPTLNEPISKYVEIPFLATINSLPPNLGKRHLSKAKYFKSN
jgi:hypothetical protein